MRQKTQFSVVGNDVKDVAFVSETEGSDLGIPWPDGPPSSDCPVVWHADGPPLSDCPVGWHADGGPRRHRARGRGSRPVLAQNQGVRVPIPAGGFYAPKKHVPMCFCVPKMLFWGDRAAGAGGTGRPRQGNRPLIEHQPIPLTESKNPKGKPGWGMKAFKMLLFT